MGYYDYGIMDSDRPRDLVYNICNIIGVDANMKDEIIICLNNNSPLDKGIKKYLMVRFSVGDVEKKIFNEFNSQYSFKTLFFVYALARKVNPDFDDGFLLCSFNINFLNMLKKSYDFVLPEKRMANVISFYNDICDAQIVAPKNLNFLVKDFDLFNSFLEKIKDEIFINKELSKDNLYDFKKCLLRINNEVIWEYPFKEEICMTIDKRCLDASISSSLVDKRRSCKI